MNLSSPSALPPQRRDNTGSSPGVEALLRRPPYPSHRFVGVNPVQTMSMVSVIAAIFVSITLSTAIVVAVVCCRHVGSSQRRSRRTRLPWVPRRGGGYAATADVVVACEMDELDVGSFDQCSLSTTADDVRRSQQLPLCDDDRSGLQLPSSRTWSAPPSSRRSYDSVSTPSASRLLKCDHGDAASSDEDAGSDDGDTARSADDSFHSVQVDDLRQLHDDDDDSTSTSTNETAFSDDAQPQPPADAAPTTASLQPPLQPTHQQQSSLESAGHI